MKSEDKDQGVYLSRAVAVAVGAILMVVLTTGIGWATSMTARMVNVERKTSVLEVKSDSSEKRLDRIEGKLDQILERLSK